MGPSCRVVPECLGGSLSILPRSSSPAPTLWRWSMSIAGRSSGHLSGHGATLWPTHPDAHRGARIRSNAIEVDATMGIGRTMSEERIRTEHGAWGRRCWGHQYSLVIHGRTGRSRLYRLSSSGADERRRELLALKSAEDGQETPKEVLADINGLKLEPVIYPGRKRLRVTIDRYRAIGASAGDLISGRRPTPWSCR